MSKWEQANKQIKQLIDYSIVGAAEFVDDMMLDMPKSEIEDMTITNYRNMLKHSASDTLSFLLDPEKGGADTLNDYLIELINERVNESTTIKFAIE